MDAPAGSEQLGLGEQSSRPVFFSPRGWKADDFAKLAARAGNCCQADALDRDGVLQVNDPVREIDRFMNRPWIAPEIDVRSSTKRLPLLSLSRDEKDSVFSEKLGRSES